MNANTELYDKTLDRAAMIRLYERRVSGKISLILDGHTVRVDKLIRDAEKTEKGFRKLQEAIDQDIRKTYTDAFRVSKKNLLEFADDQNSYTYGNMERIFGRAVDIKPVPRAIPEEIVLQRPLYQNKTLEAGWQGVAISGKKKIESIIRRGIAESMDVEDIAKEVERSGYNLSRAQSRTLVVTSITSVQSQVDQEVYAANKKYIEGWQYIAVLDARTSELCAHRDGTIYPAIDVEHLPPAHWHCRSTTCPVFKSWDDMASLESVAAARRRNLEGMSPKMKSFYDGQTPMRESYDEWLRRQPTDVQLKHLGDYQKLDLFRSEQLKLKQFTNAEGNSIGIRELRSLSDSGYALPNDTRRFALAKEKLDAMQLGAVTPDDIIRNATLTRTLKDYYILQGTELDGTLSLTNYRGTLIGVKKAVKNRVLTSPPREDQLIFNPITGRYQDVRLYQPNAAIFQNNMRLVQESDKLLPRDKKFITDFVDSLDGSLGMNERAVITDNLRIIFGRFRENGQLWDNFKGVVQGQIKFDVMNVSDFIETQIRKDTDFLKKLSQDNFLDPILGPVQMQDLHDKFISNIMARNKWEDKVAPKISEELRDFFDRSIPRLWKGKPFYERLSDSNLQQFYLRFAHRLSLADMPDRDNFAVGLGRDLFNLANINGRRNDWYNLGMKLLNNNQKFFDIETFGTQKRRMKSRIGGKYFGPYYDTISYNIRVTDPRIQEYAKLNRSIDVGLRVGVTTGKNRLIFREGYKTYWIDRGVLGFEDTRIPIVSSFSEFPEEFIDKRMVNALNWAAKTEYKIDPEYYDFTRNLLDFTDDRGRAEFYHERNEFRKFLASRSDSYERIKSMQWLKEGDKSFSNHPFIDYRGRVYDRGFISPQAGETYRPFLNSAAEKSMGVEGYNAFQDQVGSFLGGLSDYFEGRMDSLTITGRQKIAKKWRPDLIKIGNAILRNKPADIRFILENNVASKVDGEELSKFYRLAMETAKIDRYLGGKYTDLAKLKDYKTGLAMEQDASSSGAQIIALTTRNKALAELSNVVPTMGKKRLYDEIANATYNDPRFRKLNKELNLTEKDLRKAAKAQNMVSFYGAGERTGALNVEGKLAKILEKDKDVLVVKASERDQVLGEISAQAARYQKIDPQASEDLLALRDDVKDIFNKGMDPGDDIMDALYFLDPKTLDLVEKLSMAYDKIVTPNDFKSIATIMSEHMAERVPVLKTYTRFMGRLAEDFLKEAKPSKADFDWKTIGKLSIRGPKGKSFVLPDKVSQVLGLKAGEPVSEKVLKRFGFWRPNGNLDQIIYGIDSPEARRTGANYFKTEVTGDGIEFFYANKLPKSWTNVPSKNFDGKVIEQHFTQTFEERLAYRNPDGTWSVNILQVPQKTEATWWEQLINKSGKINDIADSGKARTAYGVNTNHSNDAVIVKRFLEWGRKNGIGTSTVHDAFFTNIADMMPSREALRGIYAELAETNIIKDTLDEMKARGLPNALYKQYLEEATDIGLIPVPGKSKIGGKTLTEKDILRAEDILEELSGRLDDDRAWYGVG